MHGYWKENVSPSNLSLILTLDLMVLISKILTNPSPHDPYREAHVLHHQDLKKAVPPIEGQLKVMVT